MRSKPDLTYLASVRVRPGEMAPDPCKDCGQYHRLNQLDDKQTVGWQCGGRTHRVGVLVVTGDGGR